MTSSHFKQVPGKIVEIGMDHNLKYRPDIDGLRALAVLGVVLFHAGLGVPGGYVGVDIFFVISGFLITSLILKDLRGGTFSMIGFWERRIRRIFPALAVMVATCLVVGWFIVLPFGYLVLAQSAIALSFFASNIQFWRTTNYFGPEGEENPLLHTWSLSVEEQFYLVVPLLLAGLYAWKREKFLPWVVGVGALASFFLSIHWLQRDPGDAFYLLPSRAWELAFGAMVVFARPPKSSLSGSLSALAGLILIVGTFIFYNEHDPFPGLAALPPVAGTTLVIWGGIGPATAIHQALSFRPLVAIGLLSYSLYLWHWPFFAFHRYVYGKAPGLLLSLGYVGAAIAISVLSLHFVERPFRKRRWAAKRRHIFLTFFVGSGIMVMFSLLVYVSGGMPSRLPADVARLDRVDGNSEFAGFSKTVLPSGGVMMGFGENAGEKSVLVWGDSHAGIALHAFDGVCRECNLGAVAITRGGTPPVLGWSGWPTTTKEHQAILRNSEFAREYFIKNLTSRPSFVILVFRWSHYVPRKKRLPQIDNTPAEGFGDALVETVKFLQNNGARVAIMLEPPVFANHVPRSVALNAWRGYPPPRLTLQQHEKFNEDYAGIMEKLRSGVPGVSLLEPLHALIGEGQEVEFVDDDGVLLFRDEHHLTARGAARLKPMIRKFLTTPQPQRDAR